MRRLCAGVVIAALSGFYLAAAGAHARRVNTFKARGDQSGYLWDAENVYANWHGRQPPVVIGERNRMPLYAGYLALFYSPSMSDDEFFEIAKRWNIYLSLVLLAALGLVFARFLPEPAAANLLLVVAFGYFVFKAGYAQAELLFYVLFFLAFLCMVRVLAGDPRTPSALVQAAGAGGFAALAHLTKAALLPLIVIFVMVAALWSLRSPRRLLAPVIMLAVFLAVLSPYLTTNKRVFGRYFYNVNTTFYMWYDDWPQASVGTIKHGDGVGWPAMPREELPGAGRYWREHSLGQIADRIGAGLADMVVRSYATFWYLKYVVLYTAFLLALAARHPRELVRLCRAHAPLTAFLALYAATYLLAIAFYAPVSGTGTTRFLLGHILPLLFTLSLLFVRAPFADTVWGAGSPLRVTPRHFHLLVSVMMGFDLVFVIWPRLMTTYGGF